MATRHPRRGSSPPASDKTRNGPKGRKPKKAAAINIDEAAERAARLGITAERVLLEYASIAFADLRHLIEWGPDGIRLKASGELSEGDARAISEIVPGNDPERSRVKLYDKKAALDAIARHLGMFPLPARREQPHATEQEAEDPREFLARELARLAAGGDQE